MSKIEEEVHVVMVPWLAFGHMIPFLELSIALAKSNIHVSFLSTPRNIQRLPKIPPNLAPLIHFIPLPLEYSDHLPENAEATIDIPADKMDDLKIACDLLQQPIKDFIAKKSPNWIIVDFFPHWAIDIGQDLNIPVIINYVFTASAATFFWIPEFLTGDQRRQARQLPEDLMVPPDWIDFPSEVAYTRKNEAIAMHNVFYKVNASGIADGDRLIRLLQASRAVCIRTCAEFESDYVELFAKLAGKPVFPVGLLPPEKPDHTVNRSSDTPIFKWLDRQKPRSVVFVGFGSETKLNKEQIHEIAHGVELSDVPFIWALRKPDENCDDDELLPLGFRQRTAEQGVVHLGWAPQREILGHPSIGGSLFHAGWGSIIETMQYGHVLVLLPFVFDQSLNAKLIVEKGLGVEVERDEEDGSFNRNGVANALKKAMVSDELRQRSEIAGREIFGDRKLHRNYIDKFAEYLKRESHIDN
ncbi:hypothetical protein ACP275_02G181600 [Erythranthe tilingii]